MASFEKSDRNRVRRLPERGVYDAATIYAIVDEALICHVGFVHDGQPFVIPTIHAREGDTIYLHGAKASRLLEHARQGESLCMTVTLLDGIVAARSAFHSSMNYRSAVLFGRGQVVEEPGCQAACTASADRARAPRPLGGGTPNHGKRNKRDQCGGSGHRKCFGQNTQRPAERRRGGLCAADLGGCAAATAGVSDSAG